MTQTLAIRGHYYSGNKVISLLVSLGGNNTKGYDGSKIDYFYYINSNGDIDCILQDNMLITQWETHSLLTFSEKYGNNPPQRFYYNENTDKGKVLNQEFNEVYDAITTAYDKLNEFYMEHCAFDNNNVKNKSIRIDINDLWDMLGNCREIAHEVAEHFTWDN